MQRLYLYLASRNKKGIKLITVLQSREIVNAPVKDLSELQLTKTWESQIAQIIHDNRMLYEPRMETAKDYNELRERLKHRGYTNVPMGVVPALHLQAYKIAPTANTSSCKVRKVMLRKKKG